MDDFMPLTFDYATARSAHDVLEQIGFPLYLMKKGLKVEI
jgi:hypothetical protein